jgi:hypothetical protein
MTLAHAWRVALPGQECQECRWRQRSEVAVWVLRWGTGAEELLCGPCAPWVAKMFDLTLPAGAAASAQTSEAHAASNSVGLGTNHRGNL